MNQAAPGWYSDPAGSSALRWWNGGRWTTDLRHVEPDDFEASSAAVSVPAYQSELPQNGYPSTGYPPDGYQPAGHQANGFQPAGYQPAAYQPDLYQPGTGAFQSGYQMLPAGQETQVSFVKRNKYAL